MCEYCHLKLDKRLAIVLWVCKQRALNTPGTLLVMMRNSLGHFFKAPLNIMADCKCGALWGVRVRFVVFNVSLVLYMPSHLNIMEPSFTLLMFLLWQVEMSAVKGGLFRRIESTTSLFLNIQSHTIYLVSSPSEDTFNKTMYHHSYCCVYNYIMTNWLHSSLQTHSFFFVRLPYS